MSSELHVGFCARARKNLTHSQGEDKFEIACAEERRTPTRHARPLGRNTWVSPLSRIAKGWMLDLLFRGVRRQQVRNGSYRSFTTDRL